MKSIEHVRLMKQVLINKLEMLPDKSTFGDSTEPDRERIHGWIIDLAYIENFGTPPDDYGDVAFWFRNERWSPLSDYEEARQEFAAYEKLLRYAVWLNL